MVPMAGGPVDVGVPAPVAVGVVVPLKAACGSIPIFLIAVSASGLIRLGMLTPPVARLKAVSASDNLAAPV